MDALKNWFGDTFYKVVENTTTYSGYYSERVSTGQGYQYTTFELPFDVTVLESVTVLDAQAVAAALIVILVFVTVVTVLRRAVFNR